MKAEQRSALCYEYFRPYSGRALLGVLFFVPLGFLMQSPFVLALALLSFFVWACRTLSTTLNRVSDQAFANCYLEEIFCLQELAMAKVGIKDEELFVPPIEDIKPLPTALKRKPKPVPDKKSALNFSSFNVEFIFFTESKLSKFNCEIDLLVGKAEKISYVTFFLEHIVSMSESPATGLAVTLSTGEKHSLSRNPKVISQVLDVLK